MKNTILLLGSGLGLGLFIDKFSPIINFIVTYQNYFLIYIAIVIFHFLGICSQGRKHGHPVDKWDRQDWLINLGLSFAFFIDYFPANMNWLTKEREFVLPKRRIK